MPDKQCQQYCTADLADEWISYDVLGHDNGSAAPQHASLRHIRRSLRVADIDTGTSLRALLASPRLS